jgi:hypothetical protein
MLRIEAGTVGGESPRYQIRQETMPSGAAHRETILIARSLATSPLPIALRKQAGGGLPIVIFWEEVLE